MPYNTKDDDRTFDALDAARARTQELIDENNRLLADIDRLKREIDGLQREHLLDMLDAQRSARAEIEEARMEGGWME